jgi:hypothetical protein
MTWQERSDEGLSNLSGIGVKMLEERGGGGRNGLFLIASNNILAMMQNNDQTEMVEVIRT